MDLTRQIKMVEGDENHGKPRERNKRSFDVGKRHDLFSKMKIQRCKDATME